MERVREATNIVVDTSLKAESFLLEELHHVYENASHINSEGSGMYNVYLIVASIIVLLGGTLQIIAFDFRSQGYVKIPFLLDDITILVLIFGGVLSFIFLLSFLRVVQRKLHSVVAINKIRAFYLNYLKPQMPTLGEVFQQQDDTEYLNNVPFYFRHFIILIGSLSFGGAFYCFFGNLVQSLFIFAVVFFLQQGYCQLYLYRFGKKPNA
jgi:hypothetical protein